MSSHLPVSRLQAPSSVKSPSTRTTPHASTTAIGPGSLSASTEPLADPLPTAGGDSVKLGDRVEAAGGRSGVVRFLGPTDFGPGTWVGIELSEPKGRNDGSVNGKRYFKVKENFGLFAPADKVKILSKGAPTRHGIPTSTSNSSLAPPSTTTKSGSQESVNSSSTAHKSLLRPANVVPVSTDSVFLDSPESPPVVLRRAGQPVASSFKTAISSTSLKASQTGLHGSMDKRAYQAENITALQKLLKEKEDYIAQMAKHRTSHEAVDKIPGSESDLHSLSQQKRQFEQLQEELAAMRQREMSLVKEKEEMEMFLLEEKQKVEDLQFQIEERNIDSTSMKHRVDQDESRLFELEEQLNEERIQRETLESQIQKAQQQLQEERRKAHEAEEGALAHLDEVERLQGRLLQLEAQLREATERMKDDSTTQMLQARHKEVAELQQKVADTEVQVREKEAALAKLQEEVQSLRAQQESSARATSELSVRVQELQREETELKRALQQASVQERDLQQQIATAQSKTEVALQARHRAEAEMEQLTHSSGSTSEQVARLQTQIKERTDQLERMQEELFSQQHKMRMAEEDLVKERANHQTALASQLEQRRAQEARLHDEAEQLRAKVQTQEAALQAQRSKHETELADLRQVHTQALAALVKEMDDAKLELTQTVSGLESANRDAEEAAKRVEEMRTELASVGETLRKCEAERVELIQAKRNALAEKEALTVDLAQKQAQLLTLRDTLADAQRDRDTAEAEKIQAQKNLVETRSKYDEAKLRNDLMVKEKSDLEERMKRLNSDMVSFQHSTSSSGNVSEELGQLAATLKQTRQELFQQQSVIQQLEQENAALKVELDTFQKSLRELKSAEDSSGTLEHQLQSLLADKTKLSREIQQRDDELSVAQKRLQESEERLTSARSEKDAALESHREKILELETEKKSLLKKLEEAEYLFVEADRQRRQAARQANGTNEAGDHPDGEVNAKARENAEKQITYLNRDIDELQAKNEKLQRRINELTTGKQAFVAGGPGLSSRNSEQRLQDRVFCDHCEVFDLHDTQDCPETTVTGDVQCDVCGKLGHSTNDCPDDETW